MQRYNTIQDLLKENKGKLLLSICLLSLSGIIETLSILGLTPIVDILFNPGFENASGPTKKIVELLKSVNIDPSLEGIIILFLALVLLKNIINFISKYWLIKVEYKILQNYIEKVLTSFLFSSWRFFSGTRSGELGNTFIKETEKVRDTFQVVSFILANLIRIFFFFILAVCLSYKVTLIMMLLLGISLIPFSLLGKRSYAHNKIAIEASNNLHSAYEETFTQAKLIISYAKQKSSISKVTKHLNTYVSMMIKTAIINFSTPLFFEPIGYAIILLSVYIGHKYLGIPAAELLIVLYSIRSISTLGVQTVGQKNRLQELSPALEQINKLSIKARELEITDGLKDLKEPISEIKIKDLSFSYGQ